MKITYFDLETGKTAIETADVSIEELTFGKYSCDNKRHEAFGLTLDYKSKQIRDRFLLDSIEMEEYDRKIEKQILKDANHGYPTMKVLTEYWYKYNRIAYWLERDAMNRLFLSYRVGHGGSQGKILIQNPKMNDDEYDGPTEFLLWLTSSLKSMGIELDTVPDFEGYQERKLHDKRYTESIKLAKMLNQLPESENE